MGDQKQNKPESNTFAIIGIILLIGALYYMVSGEISLRAPARKTTHKEVKTPTQRQGIWAVTIAKDFVKNLLKSPSTAHFGLPKMSKLSENTWQVSGNVDSQNGFGAMIRSFWYIEMVADPQCEDYAKYACWEIQQGPIITQR